MPLIYGADELGAMWGVRRVFDPAGVMNPGKVLPEEAAGVWGEPVIEAAGD